MSWYALPLTRRRHDVRLHEGPARKILPGAGASKSPEGIGTGIQELEQAYKEIKARLSQQGQETLLQLADLENELREETSLTSFVAGFQLGLGIARELEPYSFEDEEENRATERVKMRYSHIKN